jgi:hypothetical protein
MLSSIHVIPRSTILFSSADIPVVTSSMFFQFQCIAFLIITSLRYTADPFECHASDDAWLNRHYSVYASTMNQSDYRNAILLRYLFSFLSASVRNVSVLPGSDIDSSLARHGLRPRHVDIPLPLTYISILASGPRNP